MDIKFCHTPYPQELSIYAKDMAVRRALQLEQNTHMRNKLVVFLFLNAVSLRTNLFISTQD